MTAAIVVTAELEYVLVRYKVNDTVVVDVVS